MSQSVKIVQGMLAKPGRLADARRVIKLLVAGKRAEAHTLLESIRTEERALSERQVEPTPRGARETE